MDDENAAAPRSAGGREASDRRSAWIWLALSGTAALSAGVSSVPIWFAALALLWSAAPATFSLALRVGRAGAPPALLEIEVTIWAAAAASGIAVTGGAASPLVAALAIPVVRAVDAGRMRLALEAGVLALLGYGLGGLVGNEIEACRGACMFGTAVPGTRALGAAFGWASLLQLLMMLSALTLSRRSDVARGVDPPSAAADRDLEAALEAAKAAEARAEAAESALEARTRFFAQTSHELRTPLNAIVGFAEIMKNGLFGALPPRYREYATMTFEGARALELVVDDVLDLARIEAGKYDIAPELLDVREHLSGATEFHGQIGRPSTDCSQAGMSCESGGCDRSPGAAADRAQSDFECAEIHARGR